MDSAGPPCALALSLALFSCSSDPEPAQAGDSGAGGVLVGGSAGASQGGSAGAAGGGGTSSGGTGGQPIDVFYASFVAETQAGESPASVTFHNQTAATMTLWMEQALFQAVPPATSEGPKLAASAAVDQDTTAGKHIENACVQFEIAELSGPEQLIPGKHYSISLVLEDGVGFVGALAETSGEPFVALRAKSLDPNTSAFHPSQLELIAPQRDRVGLRWKLYDDYRTPYSYAGPGKLAGTLRFVSGDGRHYTGTEPVELSGAPGYTVVVDAAPAAGAVAVIKLVGAP